MSFLGVALVVALSEGGFLRSPLLSVSIPLWAEV